MQENHISKQLCGWILCDLDQGHSGSIVGTSALILVRCWLAGTDDVKERRVKPPPAG